MCLAIAMYLITGTIGILSQIFVAVGTFLLTLLGRCILFVCSFVYTVSNHRQVQTRPGNDDDDGDQPFETMYPEGRDSIDDDNTMSQVSLETITSLGSARSNAPKFPSTRRNRIHDAGRRELNKTG